MAKRDEIKTEIPNNEDFHDVQTEVLGFTADDIRDFEQVTENELPIMSIHADTLQPRHIVPHEIRSEFVWDGDPTKMPDILQAWAERLYKTNNDMPIKAILQGLKETSAYYTGDKFVDNFLKLLELGASIRALGLQQPIAVRLSRGAHRIIFGERRWTALQLLNHFLPDEDHTTIPAKVLDVSEWDLRSIQVSENKARQDTNAIGTAREFMLLLGAAYDDNPEYTFETKDALSTPDCDRNYFAQFMKLRIPRGMGAKFEAVLGISTGQMRQYAKLLALTDDYKVDNALWNLADEYDWSENFLRETYQLLSLEEISEALYRYDRNGIDISNTEEVTKIEAELRELIRDAKEAKAQAKAQPEPVVSPYSVGQHVRMTSGALGTIRAISDTGKLTIHIKGEMYSVPNMDASQVDKVINELTFNTMNNPKTTPTPPSSLSNVASRFGNKPVPPPQATPTTDTDTGIKKYMLRTGVKIKIKGNDTIWRIQKPPIGSSSLYTCKSDTGVHRSVAFAEIVEIVPPEQFGNTPSDNRASDPIKDEFILGQDVRTRTGRIGQVVGVSGKQINVKTANGTAPHNRADLTIIEPEEETEAVIPAPVRAFINWDDLFSSLHSLSVIFKHEEATKSIKELGAMTEDEIVELHNQDTLVSVLMSHHTEIAKLLNVMNLSLSDMFKDYAKEVKKALEGNPDEQV